MTRLRTAALVLCIGALATTSIGCPATTFANDLAKFQSYLSIAETVISAIQVFGDSVLATNATDKAAFDQAVAQAEASAAAAQSAANGAADLKDNNVAKAFQDFESTYSSLLALAQSFGVKVSATSAKPGAEVRGGVLVVPSLDVLRPAMLRKPSGTEALNQDSTLPKKEGVRPAFPDADGTAVAVASAGAHEPTGTPGGPDHSRWPITVRESDGCPAGTVSDGVIYATMPGELDCSPPSLLPPREKLSGDVSASVPFAMAGTVPAHPMLSLGGAGGCDQGWRDVTPMAPGQVCLRDGVTWTQVLCVLRAQENASGRVMRTGFGSGPLADSIVDMAHALPEEECKISSRILPGGVVDLTTADSLVTREMVACDARCPGDAFSTSDGGCICLRRNASYAGKRGAWVAAR